MSAVRASRRPGSDRAKRARKLTTYEYARQRAEFRLQELVLEARLLLDLLPHLRDTVNRDELPIGFLMATRSGALTRKPVKRPRKK